jgi:hypothetical protein
VNSIPKFISMFSFYLHNQYCPLRLNVTEVNRLVELNPPVDVLITANQMTSLKSAVHQINMILVNKSSVYTINILPLKIRDIRAIDNYQQHHIKTHLLCVCVIFLFFQKKIPRGGPSVSRRTTIKSRRKRVRNN